MLRELLQVLKADPDGADLIACVTLPLFAEDWSDSRWRFVSKPVKSLALDGALLAQVRPHSGQLKVLSLTC